MSYKLKSDSLLVILLIVVRINNLTHNHKMF